MHMPMSEVSTTKMTSKGQVVIPEEIREYMHLESGVKFIVMATSDSIIFKRVMPIPQKDVKQLLKASQAMAKKYKFKESDLQGVVSEVRGTTKVKSSKTKRAATKRK
jgi:AbrB family looped-hinge helix DNA binding protein